MIMCFISIVITSGGLNWIVPHQAKGSIVKEDKYNYVADFSKDLEKYNDVVGKYNEVLVSKDKCVRLN